MTIPVSSVVNVSIAVGAIAPARKGFGTMNIITAEAGIGLAERIRSYSDLDGVVADFATSTEAYKAANTYFGQSPKPKSLKISTRFATDQSAQLRGGSVVDNATNLALFVGITDGTFTMSIDGVPNDVTAISFAGDTNLTDVAATIEAAIQAEIGAPWPTSTCTYDGSRFFIESSSTGITSTISFATETGSGTDVSSLLQIKQGEGTKIDGIAAETITASLAAINNVNSDWYGFIFTKEVRDLVLVNTESAVSAAATWALANDKVFANTTNDLDSYDSVATTDIGSVLKLASQGDTITTFSSYPNEYPSASILGRAFTVDFAQPNSTITLKFKQLPGITVESLTTNQLATLTSKNINALIDVGGSFMFSESVMATGVFFDEVHGLDWLTNAIQTNIFSYLFTRPTKVPYTNKGTAATEQQLIKALEEARRNGLAAPGETADGEFLGSGYKTIATPVEDVDQSNVDARNYPGLSFVLLGAGAIHGVQVNGTFER